MITIGQLGWEKKGLIRGFKRMVAQLVEHRRTKSGVASSNPARVDYFLALSLFISSKPCCFYLTMPVFNNNQYVQNHYNILVIIMI